MLNPQLRAAYENSFVVDIKFSGIFAGFWSFFGGLHFGALKFTIGQILPGGTTAICGFTLNSVKVGMSKGPETYFL